MLSNKKIAAIKKLTHREAIVETNPLAREVWLPKELWPSIHDFIELFCDAKAFGLVNQLSYEVWCINLIKMRTYLGDLFPTKPSYVKLLESMESRPHSKLSSADAKRYVSHCIAKNQYCKVCTMTLSNCYCRDVSFKYGSWDICEYARNPEFKNVSNYFDNID